MATANTKRNSNAHPTDLYNTPDAALDALNREVNLNPYLKYFDPCSGLGKVADYFDHLRGMLDFAEPGAIKPGTEDNTYRLVTNDLYLYGKHKPDHNLDFLNPGPEIQDAWRSDVIVTNPPYTLATEFILQGFNYAPEQFHLLRIQFLEGCKRQKNLLVKGHLKTVYPFINRISSSKGEKEVPSPNATFYAWFHFDSRFRGHPTIKWI